MMKVQGFLHQIVREIAVARKRAPEGAQMRNDLCQLRLELGVGKRDVPTRRRHIRPISLRWILRHAVAIIPRRDRLCPVCICKIGARAQFATRLPRCRRSGAQTRASTRIAKITTTSTSEKPRIYRVICGVAPALACSVLR